MDEQAQAPTQDQGEGSQDTTAPASDAATATDAADTATDAAVTATDAADTATTAPAGSEVPGESAPVLPNGMASDSTTSALGPDPLAKLDDDNSAFVLGMIPVIVMAVALLVGVAFYIHRRRKNWSELDDALRIDGGDTPIGSENFTTKDMQEMDPTRPSQLMSEIKD